MKNLNLNYQLAIWLAASIVQRTSNASTGEKEWLDLAIESAEDCLKELKKIKSMED